MRAHVGSPDQKPFIARAVLVLGAGLAVVVPGGTAELGRGGGRSRLVPMVTLIHHHGTRGLVDNALPILDSVGARATLALVSHELERTNVPPEWVSRPDQPGGLGNVEPISVGPADTDGLFRGRLFDQSPGAHLDEAQIRTLVAAGWELAFHGADHTAQSIIVAQTEGPEKLARAYAAGIADIRRLLGDPAARISTNTLASNGWNPAVRTVASASFDWTEVRWSGAPNHVPVMYWRGNDAHGTFNSIDFQRASYDGVADLDALVPFALTEPGGWLILQLHDVVRDPADSIDPQRAMTVDEYARLIQGLQAAGIRFVTFAEGAELIRRANSGNVLRNTRFGVHTFRPSNTGLPLDWYPWASPTPGAATTFDANGRVSFHSPAEPAWFSLVQPLDAALLVDGRFALRFQADSSGLVGGTLEAMLSGPAAAKVAPVSPAGGEFCLEVDPRPLGAGDTGLEGIALTLRGAEIRGRVSIQGLSLTPIRNTRDGCGADTGGSR